MKRAQVAGLTASIVALCLALMANALIPTASAAGAGSAPPVISGLAYMQKPLYDDQSLIGVSFKTSRPARPGWEYGITFFIGGKYAIPGDCSTIVFSWDTKIGGSASLIRSAGSHFKILRGTEFGYWCRGSATLQVVEHKIGSSAVGRPLGDGSTLYFRVDEAP